MSALTITPKGFAKRDALRTNEIAVQALWESNHVFESNATDDDDTREKFLVTFPYPYSNGHLHIGHAFSLTKSVFRAQFERHMGKNVLFPFAFHCTGMPIQAAANKLKTELATYGTPPQFPEDASTAARIEMEEAHATANAAKAAKAASTAESKAKGGKTKLVQKTGTGIVRQWNILKMMVPEEEIPAFVDPLHWLGYFPPIGVTHMKHFGPGVDWRRSFITTAVNPYYDAFIRWQFNTLKAKGKIQFGSRNNIFSIVDGQVCADHDRSEGEGIGPQEYVLIKLKVLEPEGGEARHDKMRKLLEGEEGRKKGVYFVPATLRPETMYGQTNCFVLPSGEYGAFWVDATEEVWIMSKRAARGLACQKIDLKSKTYFTKTFGEIRCLETFSGEELLGLPLNAPLAKYEKVYTLPLLTISMGKGTGVVTSVPSDAPDDYVALKTLQDKPDYAAKYGITPEMVNPFQVVPIISIPGYGDASAVFMCEKLKIKSSKDTAKLQKAKDETYLKGFTAGILQVGPYKGRKVSDVKAIIKEEMIANNQAHLYFEPESKVVSRTNDECVVATTDQWYLVYGEPSWRDAVKAHVLDGQSFNAYDPSALGRYEYTVGWLKEWACTRQFGLGTTLPWDTQWVIESLSDSTIYMAYYTIAHVLQGEGNLEGETKLSPGGIDPKDLTDEVFDYIFRKTPMPKESKIDGEVLERCRKEFRYWYPMDLRVSAKDLITNHLTMALYNHAAIWDDEPELWPRGYYTNGHVLVDSEKMSKSKGNFLMMEDTINDFSADATRFACADAGDSIDDANFSRATADAAILSLCNEENWIIETLGTDTLRSGTTDEYNFMDKVLTNETNRSINATAACFTAMQFREGILVGWFEMLHARNEYRSYCQDSGTPMHSTVVKKWAEALVIMICPICPHWSENMWKRMGKTDATATPQYVVKAPWPIADEEDKILTRQAKFVRDSLKTFRAQLGKAKKGFSNATILVTDSYPQWKVDTLLWMQEQHGGDDGFPSDFMKKLKERCKSLPDKKLIKFTMQFASFTKKEVDDVGPMAMETNLPFDQHETVEMTAAYFKAQLGLSGMGVDVLKLDGGEASKAVPDRITENVVPGKAFLWCR